MKMQYIAPQIQIIEIRENIMNSSGEGDLIHTPEIDL